MARARGAGSACPPVVGHTATARRLARGRLPQRMLPVLRRIWRDVFDGDTGRFTDRLLAQDWALLDPDCAGPVAGALLVAGIGRLHPGGPPPAGRGGPHAPPWAARHARL